MEITETIYINMNKNNETKIRKQLHKLTQNHFTTADGNDSAGDTSSRL